MVVFLIFIIIILFHLFGLSEEATEISKYNLETIYPDKDYYVYSIQKYYKYSFFTLKYKTNESSVYKLTYTLYTLLSDSFNFSNLFETKLYRRTVDNNSIYQDYYALLLNKYYYYLLLRFTSSNLEAAVFEYLSSPPESAKKLDKYSSMSVKDSDFIYLKNFYTIDNFLYFSVSFKKESNTTINEYNIYYSLENYNDDTAFLNSSNYYSSIDSRKRNDRYTFYYKLPFYDKYKTYICLRPGKEPLGNNNITITHHQSWPSELKKYRSSSNSSHDFIFTNISNIPIGNQIYCLVIIPNGNIIMKYKFSEENFYEDFTDMNLISPKYKFNDLGNPTEYYYFKKENKSNYLLLEILNNMNYNFSILLTEEDEYLIVKKRKLALIISCSIAGALIIAMIASLCVYHLRGHREEKEPINQVLENLKY